MAIFFMASGYCWKRENAANWRSVTDYIIRRIKTLYVPYVLFNSAMILLNNAFIRISLLTNDPRFLETGGWGARFGLSQPLNLSEIGARLCDVFMFIGDTQFGGATWFLRVLFIVSISHCVIIWALNHIKAKSLREGITVITVAAGLVFLSFAGSVLMKPVFSAYLAYLLGMLFRKAEDRFDYGLDSGVIATVGLLFLDCFGSIEMGSGDIVNPLYFICVSSVGWILLRSVAAVASSTITGKVLNGVGRRSNVILLYHFLCMRIVSFIYIFLTHGDMYLLASHPTLSNVPGWLWIAYAFAGVLLPILMLDLWRGIRAKLKNQEKKPSNA